MIPAALIAAGGNILGSALSNIGAAKREREAREYNLQMWRMNNEYNHPTSQMSRLREAGLNPNLIYGTSPTSAVGNAGSAPSPAKAAPYQMDAGNFMQHLSAGATLENTKAQTDNLRTQNTVIAQEAALKSAQTAGTMISNARTGLDYGIAKELRETSLDAARESLRNLKQETIGRELSNYFNDQTMADRVTEVAMRVRLARENLKGAELDNALKSFEKQLNSLGLTKNDPIYYRVFGGDGFKKFDKAVDRSIDNFIRVPADAVRDFLGPKFKDAFPKR